MPITPSTEWKNPTNVGSKHQYLNKLLRLRVFMANKMSNPEDNAIPVSVALRPSQLQKIDRFASGSRSDFIRTAVDYALSRVGDDYEEMMQNAIKNFLDHHWFENGLESMRFVRNSRFNDSMSWERTEEKIRRVMDKAPIGAPLESVFPSDILEWLNVYMRNIESQWQVLDDDGREAFLVAALSGYRHLKEKYGAM